MSVSAAYRATQATLSCTALCAMFSALLLLVCGAASANTWIFEPSAAIDQRVDDNYTIDAEDPDSVIATRLVGSLGLTRESQNASFSGLLRIDGLLRQNSENSGLDSNQIVFLNSKFNSARSNYGIGFNFKQDTPSRDISADITDISSVASDTGASVTQEENVARQRLVLTPNWSYNLTRRTSVDTTLTYTQVEHELPDAADAIRKQWDLANDGAPPPANLSIDDVGGVFTVFDELDDFKETKFALGVKHKLSPIVTLSAFAGFSDYKALVEPESGVQVPFEEKIPDSSEPRIRRDPKRESLSQTTTVRLGYDRAFSPTLNIGAQIGFYKTDIDESDVLRDTDATNFAPDVLATRLANRIRTEDGYLANITVSKDDGITRYSARFGVDILPSDVGSQVESLEAVGDYIREIGPLMDFSFRIRAYEPDALKATGNDEFSRRFLSMEPKLIWRFTRTWTAAASYRYRRQKSRADFQSGESNALLFSIKYTPPSAIRDAAQR